MYANNGNAQRVSAATFAAKYRSKREIFNFLSVSAQVSCLCQ
jgi:hypothetical protein